MGDSGQSSFELLGVKIDGLDHDSAIARIRNAAESKSSLSVDAACLQNLALAGRDPGYRKVLNSFDLVLPDGAPLLWAARLRGYPLPERTYGPVLMEKAVRQLPDELRHFVLGGSVTALERCAAKLCALRPGCVAGTYSPTFGDSTAEEKSSIRKRIRESGASVVWVCLGTPKQEWWIAENSSELPGMVLVAVGAAVDFLGGSKPQAPRWLQRLGFEWLFRLLTEPRRLWRRYLLDLPPAAIQLPREYLRLQRDRKLDPLMTGRK